MMILSHVQQLQHVNYLGNGICLFGVTGQYHHITRVNIAFSVLGTDLK